MTEIEEKLLRDFLGDLVASKGVARKVITENIVTFVKKVATQHHVQVTAASGDGKECNCFKNDTFVWERCPIHGGGR